jgi:hypothetical protein
MISSSTTTRDTRESRSLVVRIGRGRFDTPVSCVRASGRGSLRAALRVTIAPIAAPTPLSVTAYLRQPIPGGLIFGAFFGLTVPLTAVLLSGLPQGTKDAVRLGYFWLFGLSHFVLTFTVYLQRENLAFFATGWGNRWVYFGIPVLILAAFDCYGALGVAAALPAFDIVFRLCIRFADFLHFSRQVFGVLQLFKASWQGPFAPWLRRAENMLLWTVAILMLETYANGGTFTAAPWFVRATLWVCGALFAWVVVGYVQAARRATDRRSVYVPAAYLALNLAAAALAVSQTILYFATLAVHYVEYHVLMAPRCFGAELTPAAGVDRIFDRLRRRPTVFYGVLLTLAGVAFLPLVSEAFRRTTDGLSVRLAVHVLDGLFVLHYFIEAFIWKLGQPFYRRTIGPLYLPAPTRS